MNYRHAFHAGNHADVLKHVVLTRLLDYLRQKEKPFAVLDAHAGIGRYDLKGAEAFKTGEWKEGIGRLLSSEIDPQVRKHLSYYLNIIHDMNGDGMLRTYPGSPEIIARMLRREDRFLFNELHPEDADTLAARYAADPRAQVTRLDAAIAVKAALPFRERRGLVLIDPAYEAPGELTRLERIASHALQRMQNAVILIWYPIKSEQDIGPFLAGMAALPAPGTLDVRLMVREPFAEGGLAGSGLVILNPPFTLKAELDLLLPVLAARLGQGDWGKGSVSELTPPR